MELCLVNPDKRLGADLPAVFHSLKGVRLKTEPNSSQRDTAEEQGNGHKLQQG